MSRNSAAVASASSYLPESQVGLHLGHRDNRGGDRPACRTLRAAPDPPAACRSNPPATPASPSGRGSACLRCFRRASSCRSPETSSFPPSPQRTRCSRPVGLRRQVGLHADDRLHPAPRCLVELYAPNRLPWSVIAMAGMPVSQPGISLPRPRRQAAAIGVYVQVDERTRTRSRHRLSPTSSTSPALGEDQRVDPA